MTVANISNKIPINKCLIQNVQNFSLIIINLKKKETTK